MVREWDDSLKMLINNNSQDFVTWFGLKEGLPCWMKCYVILLPTRKF